jgi:hypothetical protein
MNSLQSLLGLSPQANYTDRVKIHDFNWTMSHYEHVVNVLLINLQSVNGAKSTNGYMPLVSTDSMTSYRIKCVCTGCFRKRVWGLLAMKYMYVGFITTTQIILYIN